MIATMIETISVFIFLIAAAPEIFKPHIRSMFNGSSVTDSMI